MSWYYAENNERRGPIEDSAFDALIAAGAVRPETLVWREGMAGWLALSAAGYRGAGSPLAPNMPPAPDESAAPRRPGVAMGVCSESGRILPRSELVEIDGRLVSAEYKNVVLQRIREGVGSTGSSIDPEALAQEIMARDYHLSVGSCISRGWKQMRRHFWLYVGATFLAMLVIYASCLTLVGEFFVFGPMTAGLYWMMLRFHRNEPASLSDAFAGFSRNFWHLAGVGIILVMAMICCFVPVLFCFGLAFAVSLKSPSVPILLASGGLAILAYLAAIYLGVCWTFSFLLAIDKQIECGAAVKLSRRIVAMHWWQVFGVLFVTGLLVGGAVAVGMIVTTVVTQVAAAQAASPAVFRLLKVSSSVFSFFISIFISPLLYSTIAVAYDDIFGRRPDR